DHHRAVCFGFLLRWFCFATDIPRHRGMNPSAVKTRKQNSCCPGIIREVQAVPPEVSQEHENDEEATFVFRLRFSSGGEGWTITGAARCDPGRDWFDRSQASASCRCGPCRNG